MSHAGAPFHQRKKPGRPLGWRQSRFLRNFKKKISCPSRRLNPVHLICIESLHLIQMSRKYVVLFYS